MKSLLLVTQNNLSSGNIFSTKINIEFACSNIIFDLPFCFVAAICTYLHIVNLHLRPGRSLLKFLRKENNIAGIGSDMKGFTLRRRRT